MLKFKLKLLHFNFFFLADLAIDLAIGKFPQNRFRDEDTFLMCKSQLYHLYCKFNLQSKFQGKAKKIISNNHSSLILGRFKNRYHIFLMKRLFMYLQVLISRTRLTFGKQSQTGHDTRRNPNIKYISVLTFKSFISGYR